MSSSEGKVADTLREYELQAAAWDSIVSTDAKLANPIFDRLHSLAKTLRGTPEGRAGIEALSHHDQQGVRLLAASESLAWHADSAVPVLEEIEAQDSLHAVSAKYTLRSYRAGALNLDW